MWKRISYAVTCTRQIGDCRSTLEPALPVMSLQSPVRMITALSRFDLPSGVRTRNEPYQVPEKAEQEVSLVCAGNDVATSRRQTAPNIQVLVSIWITTECDCKMFPLNSLRSRSSW